MSGMANLVKKTYCWLAHEFQSKPITLVLLNGDSMEVPSK